MATPKPSAPRRPFQRIPALEHSTDPPPLPHLPPPFPDTFLPPVGGLTVYVWGSVDAIPDENIPLTVRVHDECNGSDVFGSDICTCRPYLTHAIEECIKTAQEVSE